MAVVGPLLGFALFLLAVGLLLTVVSIGATAVSRRRLRTELNNDTRQLLAEAELLTVIGAQLEATRPEMSRDPLGAARAHAETLTAALRARLDPAAPAIAALDHILSRLGADHGVTFTAPLPAADEARHLAALTAACVLLHDQYQDAGRSYQATMSGGIPLILISNHVRHAVDHGHLAYAAALDKPRQE